MASSLKIRSLLVCLMRQAMIVALAGSAFGRYKGIGCSAMSASKLIQEDRLECGQGWSADRNQDKPKTLAKIVGGRDAHPGEFPFMVFLEIGDFSECGGILIDEQYILTAAHCVKTGCGDDSKPVPASIIRGYLGDHRTSSEDGEISVEFSDSIIHQDYDCKTKSNDIALLKMTKPIKYGLTSEGYGSINRVCMPEADADPEEPNEQLTVAGWGRDLSPGSRDPDLLKTGQVNVVDGDTCKQYLVHYENETRVCATNQPQGVCFGDSGGPLLRRWDDGRYGLFGVVSYGNSSRCEGLTAYTRVSHYLQWISEKK